MRAVFALLAVAVVLSACGPSKRTFRKFNDVAVQATDEADHTIDRFFEVLDENKDAQTIRQMAERVRRVVDSCAAELHEFEPHEDYGPFYDATMKLMKHYEDFAAGTMDSIITMAAAENLTGPDGRKPEVPTDAAVPDAAKGGSANFRSDFHTRERELIEAMIEAQRQYADDHDINLRGS